MADDKILLSDKSENHSKVKLLTSEKGLGSNINLEEIQSINIIDRIRKSTQNNGLGSLPVGFDEQNGDWVCINSIDPFEILYLDYQQYKFITPEIVKNNYSILEKFWQDKVGLMNTGGNRIAFKKKYGDGIIENSLLKLKKALEKLSTEQGIENYFTEINNERISKGESILTKELDKLTRDGDLSQTDFEVLFEMKPIIDLEDEEIAIIIQKLIKEKELIAVVNIQGEGWVEKNEFEGNNLLERLSSATWMTREKIIETKNSVHGVKLGYATIKTDKDFIDILETRSSWWEDLFEDPDTYFALKAWLSSYQNVESRKIFDNMIHFYKPLGKEYVKESAIRFFDPKREITIDMNSFNFFTTENIEKEVDSYISKLDGIWKVTSIDKIIFNIFQLEFSLRQLNKSLDNESNLDANSLINKIYSIFGLTQSPFDDFKTEIQTKISYTNLEETFLLLINLFYIFDPDRSFKDSNNKEYNDIEDIGLLFSENKTIFDNAFNQAEIKIFLERRKMRELYDSIYFDFLFKVFNSKIKSSITINEIFYYDSALKINYKVNKSLEGFLESNGIRSNVIEKGKNQVIEIKSSLIPKSSHIYEEFIKGIFIRHSISAENCEFNSLIELKEYIINDIFSYIKRNRNKAGLFSWGIISYAIPAIVALIGLYIIYLPPQGISQYLNDLVPFTPKSSDNALRAIYLIGFIYLSIIISLIPALLYWAINSKYKELHSKFGDPSSDVFNSSYLYPLHLLTGIFLYYIISGLLAGVLKIILYILIGIGSIFGDYKTEPTVDSTLLFFVKLSAIVVIFASLKPIYKFIEGAFNNKKIIKNYILKQVTICVIAIILIGNILDWVLYSNGIIIRF